MDRRALHRYVLMMADAILLTDWTWATLAYLVRWTRPVWVFRSKRGADRARRTYGRGGWRAITIVRVLG